MSRRWLLAMAGAVTAAAMFIATPASAQPSPSTPTTDPAATQAPKLPRGVHVARNAVYTPATKVLSAQSQQALGALGADGTLQAVQPTPELTALKPGDIILAMPTSANPAGLLRRISQVTPSGGGLTLATTEAQLNDAVTDFAASYSGPAPAAPTGSTPPTATPGVSVSIGGNELTVSLLDYVLWDIDGRASTNDDQMRASGTITFSVPQIDFSIDMTNRTVNSVSLVASFDTLRTNLTITGKVPQRGIQNEKVPFSFNLPAIPVGAISVVPAVDVLIGADGSVSPFALSGWFKPKTVDMSWGTQVGLVDPSHPLQAGVTYVKGDGAKPVLTLPSLPTVQFTPVSLTGDDKVKKANTTVNVGLRVKVYLYGALGVYAQAGPAAGVSVQQYDPQKQATPFQAKVGVMLGGGVTVKLINELNIGPTVNLTVPIYSGEGTTNTSTPPTPTSTDMGSVTSGPTSTSTTTSAPTVNA